MTRLLTEEEIKLNKIRNDERAKTLKAVGEWLSKKLKTRNSVKVTVNAQEIDWLQRGIMPGEEK